VLVGTKKPSLDLNFGELNSHIDTAEVKRTEGCHEEQARQ
jgi:hypothetical protein